VVVAPGDSTIVEGGLEINRLTGTTAGILELGVVSIVMDPL
jgi:hypothetical protein